MPDTYRLAIEASNKRVSQELKKAFSETNHFDSATMPLGTGVFLFYRMQIDIGEIDTGYYSIVFQSDWSKHMEEMVDCAGYRLHHKRHDEKYCIGQIFESPYAGIQRALLISNNNGAAILPACLHGSQSCFSGFWIESFQSPFFALKARRFTVVTFPWTIRSMI